MHLFHVTDTAGRDGIEAIGFRDDPTWFGLCRSTAIAATANPTKAREWGAIVDIPDDVVARHRDNDLHDTVGIPRDEVNRYQPFVYEPYP